jgi:hypothetical protein
MGENEEAEIEKKDNDDVSYLDKLENQMNDSNNGRASPDKSIHFPFYENKLYESNLKVTKSDKKDFGYTKSDFRITSQYMSESK